MVWNSALKEMRAEQKCRWQGRREGAAGARHGALRMSGDAVKTRSPQKNWGTSSSAPSPGMFYNFGRNSSNGTVGGKR